MTARGVITLSKLCGDRWCRLLPVPLAAAYCGMLVPEFLKSRFATLIVELDGKERVDRAALDAMIDEAVKEGSTK